MNWKEKLRKLEINKQWDDAITFMESVIKQNPNDMDAYIFMNYLLMNLLAEEQYDVTKQDHYMMLTKHYFDESYRKFATNPEYLFFTGITGVMGEWFFGIDNYQALLEMAFKLAPDNKLYRMVGEHVYENDSTEQDKQQLLFYAHLVLDPNSSIQKQLKSKGAVGEYYLEIRTNWANRIIEKYKNYEARA
jgi:hypothetical protein